MSALTLRGVPGHLLREAKALGALNGKTLKAFVVEAVARAVREEKQKWLLQENELVKVHNEVEEIDRIGKQRRQ
jgi:hypothetical protein